jgi:hypothetical protein
VSSRAREFLLTWALISSIAFALLALGHPVVGGAAQAIAAVVLSTWIIQRIRVDRFARAVSRLDRLAGGGAISTAAEKYPATSHRYVPAFMVLLILLGAWPFLIVVAYIAWVRRHRPRFVLRLPCAIVPPDGELWDRWDLDLASGRRAQQFDAQSLLPDRFLAKPLWVNLDAPVRQALKQASGTFDRVAVWPGGIEATAYRVIGMPGVTDPSASLRNLGVALEAAMTTSGLAATVGDAREPREVREGALRALESLDGALALEIARGQSLPRARHLSARGELQRPVLAGQIWAKESASAEGVFTRLGLRFPEDQVRFCDAMTLPVDPDTTLFLVDVVVQSESLLVVEAATLALGRVGTHDALPFLRAHGRGEMDPRAWTKRTRLLAQNAVRAIRKRRGLGNLGFATEPDTGGLTVAVPVGALGPAEEVGAEE